MSKNIAAELEIVGMEFPDKGIAFLDSQKVYIKHGIRGQIVSARVKRGKESAKGYITGVIKKAPYETEPDCPEFGLCGGCAYQNMPYEAECALKERTVLDFLEASGITGFDYLGLTPSPEVRGYKNKMEFSFGDFTKGGALELGMRKRNSYYEVVTPVNCNIIDGDYKKILAFTLDFFRESGDSFYHKNTHTGSLRHLIIRKAVKTGEIMVNIVTASSPLNSCLGDFAEGLSRLELSGSLVSCLHTVNDSVADAVIPGGVNVLRGRDYIYEVISGLKFKISPFSFFQTNSLAAQGLYSCVREFAQEIFAETALDLYSGTGTIAQIISGEVNTITGIEIVPEAVEAAKTNARENGIDNCDFICADVLKKLSQQDGKKADLIILDPPRDGIHPKAMPGLISAGAKRIIYVSCNPVTLARDLRVLSSSGYAVCKVKLFDMFPRTYHAECAVLLSLTDLQTHLNRVNTAF